MIRAAEVRATISQIEKYNTAVNTFRGKYGALPGDLNQATASQFGFAARGTVEGQGDGNGVIEGSISVSNASPPGSIFSEGETVMFWADLSKATLIDGSFTAASSTVSPYFDITPATTPNIAAFFPPAKMGRGNYIYAWSGGLGNNGSWSPSLGQAGDSINYFSVSGIQSVIATDNGEIAPALTMTVSEAYTIDKKLDDGLPTSGRVTAMLPLQSFVYWASGTGGYEAAPITSTPIPGNSTTCFDNGNSGANPIVYSLEISQGAGTNCGV